MNKLFFGLIAFTMFLPFLAYGQTPKTDAILKEYEAAMQAAKDGKEEEAIAIFKKLAEMGEPMSQVAMARLYMDEDGEYLPKDEQQAYQLFAKSAKTGYPQALLGQGYLLLQGEGIQKNIKQGIALIEKAASTGFYDAQVAACYFYDTDLHDGKKAYFWCSVAVHNLREHKSDILNNEMITLLEDKLTSHQIQEIQAKVAAFQPVEWKYPTDLFDK